MGSEKKEVREKQLEAVELEFDSYKKRMLETGISEKELEKSPLFRRLRAKVRDARGRIVAMDEASAHMEAQKNKGKKSKDKSKGKAKDKSKGKSKDKSGEKKQGDKKAKKKAEK